MVTRLQTSRFALLTLFCCLSAVTWAQQTISGTVRSDDREPLIGVNVLLVGTGTGTVTDIDGEFSLSAKPEDVLRFSYTGYASQDVTVGTQTRLDVEMANNATEISEVVVVGYGTQRRKDLTGAVASAPIEAFREAPNTNILQSLNGTVPGLSIGQASGAGQDVAIQIRGQNSINGNQSPLIILDGIIYSGRISDINPNDVASVDVLKDASSKAIYGAQAANGVILITSKTGRGNQKPRISYTGNITSQAPTKDRSLLGREGFLKAARDVDFTKAYLGPDFVTPNPDFNIEEDVPFFDPVLQGIRDGTDFDWLGATRQDGYITDHALSISGASNQVSYFISGGFTAQEGIVLNDSYERKSVRVNLAVDVTDWLKVGTNSFGSFSDYSGDSPNIGAVSVFTPLAKPRDPDGNLIVNPLGDNTINPLLASDTDDRDLRNRLLGIFFAEVKVPFVKGLTYRANYSNNFSFNTRQNSSIYDGGLTGGAFKNNSTLYDWTFNNILSYNARLSGGHSLDFTGLLERRRVQFESTGARGVGFSNLSLSYNSLEQGNQQFISSAAYEESYASQMGRVNYGYRSKYLLTATARRDGFSGFAANNRTAIFPSVSAGWVLSEEKFLADVSALDFLKLRAGYGVNGNLTRRYSSLATITAGESNRYVFGDGGQTLNGQGVSGLANPNLKWELTSGYNFGLDFGLLDGRVSGSVDAYRSQTKDLLFNLVLPGITGFTSITSNVGEVQNRGFELGLTAIPVRSESFSWTLGVNFFRNRNEIVSLLGFDNDDDGVEDDLVSSGLFIGQPINTIFDYEVDGIYQIGEDLPKGYSPGSYRLRDVNGDGEITPDDRTIIGYGDAGYSLGVRNTVTFKNLTLRLFVNSVQGGDNYYRAANEPIRVLPPSVVQNQNWYADIDYWSPSNPGATYRLPGTNTPFNGNRYFARDFIRLQDVSLAYNFDARLLERVGLQNLKLFVAGKNLVTLTDWEGWDPEITNEQGQFVGGLDGSRPLLRGYSVGLDVAF